jgi:hypothetical protein
MERALSHIALINVINVTLLPQFLIPEGSKYAKSCQKLLRSPRKGCVAGHVSTLNRLQRPVP